MNISIIFPHRHRQNLLMDCLDSISETTKKINDIEVLIAIDTDDEPSHLRIKYITEKRYRHMNISFLSVRQSDNFSRDYYNRLSYLALGRWIFIINDDCTFKTHHWDQILIERMSNNAKIFGDDILLGMVSDGLDKVNIKKDFCCFPVVSKEYVNLMNGCFDERCLMWGADRILSNIFRYVDKGKRKIDLLDININHISIHTGQAKKTENHERFCKILESQVHTVTSQDIINQTKFINEYIQLR